jgi:hypothetical protein
MTDIEQRLRAAMHAAVDGEQPPPDLVSVVLRRHRRHLIEMAAVTVAGAIVLAAVPVAIAWRGASHGHVLPRASATITTPVPSSPSASPSPLPSQPTTRARRGEPKWMRGLPLPPATDLQLLLAARIPAWFSTATGGFTPIGNLPRSRFPYTLTRIRSGWAALPSPKGPSCTPACPDPMLPVYFIADGAVVAHRIAVTEELSPGSGPGTMWLETYPKGTTDMGTAQATAQQITSSGWPIGLPVRLPAGVLIQQGVGSDVLLSPVIEGPGRAIYRLWDPRTRRVVRTFPNVFAADSSHIAWGICSGCAAHVLDLQTGALETVSIPAHTWIYEGSFSSDGKFLAVHLSGGVTPNGRATLARIAVIDLRARRLRVLQGSTVGVDLPEALSFGWRGGSDTLIAAVTRARPVMQIGIWHPGAQLLRVRKFPIPSGMTVVIGPNG